VEVRAVRIGEGAEEAIESFPGHGVGSTPVTVGLMGNSVGCRPGGERR
jgi:hypothetical protein